MEVMVCTFPLPSTHIQTQSSVITLLLLLRVTRTSLVPKSISCAKKITTPTLHVYNNHHDNIILAIMIINNNYNNYCFSC